MSDDDLMAAHSSEIGIDSLVSVNIRSWFLKHLQVGIPVLKIMSNDNMGNLVQIAVDTIPPELVPQLHRDGEESSKLDTSYDSPSTPTQATSQTPLTEADSPPRDSQIYKGSIASTGIDWEVESRPPADLANIPLFSALLAPVMPPRRIVLTGAGGLLGHHLLNYLLEHTAAEKIFCIALRNVAARLKNDELPQPSSRIEYYEGDLAAPLLGLNSEQASTIFGTADVVIHNGADTSHMKGYRDLWETNVNSTITLTRLCLPRRVPFHYISSVGLAILYGQDSFPPVKVTGPNSALPAPDGSFGYASAKWTCERFLERTHEMYGGFWDVCIHRPSTIIRDGTDAVGKKADLDWLNAMISHAKASKTVPEIHRNHGALDLVLVENVCADITEHVVHKDERMKRGEVSYVHEVGDVVIPLDRLQDIGLQEPEGKQFDLLPMDEWISNAMEAGLHPAIAALIELIDEPGGPTYPRLLKDVPV
jgi:thioester reductase-like protein